MDMADGLIALLVGLLLFGLFIKVVVVIITAILGLLIWMIRMMLWAKRSRDAGMRTLADPDDYREPYGEDQR
jgi:hypothetical protein